MKKRNASLSILGFIGLFVIVGLNLPLPVQAKPSLAEPASVGISRDRLDRISKVTRQYVDDELISGVVTLVARKGEIVHFEAQGYRDVASKTPMTTDSIFSIASMTKPITSAAIMMLWEEGRLRLTDPLEKFLPEFKDVKLSTTGDISGNTGELVAPKSKINIRQLLSHTSGLSASGRNPSNAYYTKHVRTSPPGDTIEDWVKRIAELPLTNEPGENWVYSHATDVLARVVEVISGMTYAEYLEHNIFQPLRMVDTGHYPDSKQQKRYATVYSPGKDLRIVENIRASNEGNSKVLYRGAGGLTSTALDYFRFCQMMLNGGELDGVRLLGRKTVELMTSDHVPSFTRPGQGFGLGYAIQTDRGLAGTPLSEGTFRWGGALGTQFFIDPEEKLVTVMMIHLTPNGHLDLKDKFRNLVYQSIID